MAFIVSAPPELVTLWKQHGTRETTPPVGKSGPNRATSRSAQLGEAYRGPRDAKIHLAKYQDQYQYFHTLNTLRLWGLFSTWGTGHAGGSLLDYGCGLGAASTAWKLVFPEYSLFLHDSSKALLKQSLALHPEAKPWDQQTKVDWVVLSFVLNELPPPKRLKMIQHLLTVAKKGVILIEPAMTKFAQELSQLRNRLLEDPFVSSTFPCPGNAPCPLAQRGKKDYCNMSWRFSNLDNLELAASMVVLEHKKPSRSPGRPVGRVVSNPLPPGRASQVCWPDGRLTKEELPGYLLFRGQTIQRPPSTGGPNRRPQAAKSPRPQLKGTIPPKATKGPARKRIRPPS